MARRLTGRFGTLLALLIALGGALLVGGALVITWPFAPQGIQAAPTANRQSAPVAVGAVAMPLPTATTPVRGTAPPAEATTSNAPSTTALPLAITSTTRLRTSTPVPVAWTIVGRWQADQLIITEPFTTPGPWRLCWAQPDARILFQVMVGNPEQTAWDLLSGPTGATTGAFDFPQGGSYRLMFHSETSYTALVLAQSGNAPSEPPPCS